MNQNFEDNSMNPVDENVEKSVEKSEDENKKSRFYLWFSRIILLLNIALFAYSKIILRIAEKYPKEHPIGINLGEKTYCHFVETWYLNDYIAYFFYAIVLLYIFLIVKSRKNKSTKRRIVLGMVLSIIVYFWGMYGPVQCSINQTWKPVLYLYPEENTKVEVKLEREDLLGTTYPKYNHGWKVMASPDGNIMDSNGKNYYALYWDQRKETPCNFEDGFYVESEDAIPFLEEKLAKIGFNDKERNEFIMFCLPVLEQNKKSIVHFDLTNDVEQEGKLLIIPKPDSLLRVHINIKKVNHKVNIKEQKLDSFERVGFAAVEWGGTIY